MSIESLPKPRDADGAQPALRVYLVEDSSIIRHNLVEALQETLPLEVVGAASSEAEAQAWLANPPCAYDLVVIDIFLKSGSGLGVLAQRLPLDAPGRWVVLSNHATPEMRRKCTELGADAVFDKSNEIEALLLYCKRLAGMDAIDDVRNSLHAAL